jgi:hypothetical protein
MKINLSFLSTYSAKKHSKLAALEVAKTSLRKMKAVTKGDFRTLT